MRGDWWTTEEWADWSDRLAELIPEGDESRLSNPEAAQESIIEDCLRAYVEQKPKPCGQRAVRTSGPGTGGYITASCVMGSGHRGAHQDAEGFGWIESVR